MSVTLVLAAGTDLDIVNAARVSVNREHQEFTAADAGLIRRLMRDGHSSPFAQVWAKFRIECSIGCSRQVARHGHYVEINEHSTRYSEMADEFVTPALKRQVGKAMAYAFEPLPVAVVEEAQASVRRAYERAYQSYYDLLKIGVSREDARSVLPLGMKTRLIASSHLKGWLRFLAQRTDPHAQDEIRGIANEIEAALSAQYPEAMAAWNEAGRPKP